MRSRCLTAAPTTRSDRKSTRLNSPHSLHDSLPIYTINGWDLYLTVNQTSVGTTTTVSSNAEPVFNSSPNNSVRSEEHTSELPSLPTRLPSDLHDQRMGPVPDGEPDQRRHYHNGQLQCGAGV